MIHGNSTDPVLIKKISLRVWTLRDEVEAVIKSRYKDVENPPSIDDLLVEYKTTGSFGDAGGGDDGEGGVKDASELDDSGEDEMAMAIAQAEAEEAAKAAGEEAPEAEGETSEGEEISEDGTIAEGDIEEASSEAKVLKLVTSPEELDGKTIVKQRLPEIPDDKVASGRAILSEIYMDQMYFFSQKEYLVGQSIVLEFLVPKKFLMNASVVFCRTYNMKSRIISKNNLPFRVGIKFSYLKEGERTILRNFVQSIEPDVEVVQVEEKKSEDSGGGDEFDIFDDLDD